MTFCSLTLCFISDHYCKHHYPSKSYGAFVFRNHSKNDEQVLFSREINLTKISWNWFHEKFISFYFCIIITIDVLYLEFDFEFISTNSFLLFSFEVKKLWRRNKRIQFYWFYHPTKKSKYTIAHFYINLISHF